MIFKITGGHELEGKIRISCAKNAALPQMAATLLTDEPVLLHNIPNISDIATMQEVLRDFGGSALRSGSDITLDNKRLDSSTAHSDYAREIRASVLAMGPMLARLGMVSVPLPGGCAIGGRPLDLHIKGFKAMGATIDIYHGQIRAVAQRLRGADIYLDFKSVGATENLMMAATLARGSTLIRNAAAEPEIVDLANMLNGMGARISGAGTDNIFIDGVSSLHGTSYTPIPDRIEAGTFLTAAAITGGDVTVEHVVPSHLAPVIAKLNEAGMLVEETDTTVRVLADGRVKCFDIKSMPFPGFPTDMQAQMMTLAAVANGTSVFCETVFENRFNHCAELARMGAKIKVEDRTAIIRGGRLSGARVASCDLRAGAAMVLAGLRARGVTHVTGVEHIDRGYESLEEKMNKLGANIVRINE